MLHILTRFHGNLNFLEVRIINLRTSTEPHITPRALQIFLFLKRNLTKIVTNSERVAESIRIIAYISSTRSNLRTKYERFSANNRVCFIKMDKYKKLAEIERLILAYLDVDTIKQRLSRVAEEMALDYLAKQSARTVTSATDRLAVPAQGAGRPQTPVSQLVPTTPQGSETPSSARQSTDHSEAGADNIPSRHSTIAVASTTPSSVEPSPSLKISNMVESMLQVDVTHTCPVLPSRSVNIVA